MKKQFTICGIPVFNGTNVLSNNSDGKTWTVVDKLGFYSDVLACLVTVLAGFQTDLASIPRFLWSIYPPFGKYTNAALVHDWLYTFQPCTRAQADAVLLEAMEVCGVSWFTRKVIYYNVRMFGGSYWNRDHTADQVLKPTNQSTK
jgi:hypothetical protein